MNTIEQNLREWILRNNKNMTYGELMQISRKEKPEELMDDIFYTENERKIKEEIIKSDKNRLLHFG